MLRLPALALGISGGGEADAGTFGALSVSNGADDTSSSAGRSASSGWLGAEVVSNERSSMMNEPDDGTGTGGAVS